MPRPAPLSNASTGSYPRFDTQLTPRTPHSRAGRAEEAYTAAELEQVDFDDDDNYSSVVQQQQAPLLSSSASDSFPATTGYRSRGDDFDAHAPKRTGLTTDKILSRLPLALYSSVAAVLLVLVFFSLREPEALKKYVGVTTNVSESEAAGDLEVMPTSTMPTSTPIQQQQPPPNIILISYENYTSFPLDPLEYRAECLKMDSGIRAQTPYWGTDKSGMYYDVLHVDEQVGYEASPDESSICSRTMTYQLDGWAGLLTDLALMAQVAALARERNATFFVDDRFWNRGKWSDYFEDVQAGQPGPEPGCRPPPPEEFVACPRTARHWLMNSRTARHHLDHDFMEHYADPYGHNLNRMKPFYEFGFKSFSETIRPNAQTAQLIQSARQELSEKVTAHYRNPRSDDGTPMGYLAVHIRRGDRKPTWRLPYGQNYIALSEYVDAVVQSWTRLGLEMSPSNDERLVQPFVYIASDSPEAANEFASSFSPDRVFSLSASESEELRGLASPGEYFQDAWKDLDEQVRVKATRGMVVDFAVLSGTWASDDDITPDGTVCTVSSVVCRAAAFGLGWNRSFGELDQMGMIDQEHMRWVDVDTKARVLPAWEAYRGDTYFLRPRPWLTCRQHPDSRVYTPVQSQSSLSETAPVR
ncbi:hypothetical protein FB45DRAFT_760849 [Roridomyces roridus]|uniref:Uncharacterized protein n=1 Tax=Roridomyces roridus TaxID=1738132 RepID=A0AAD7B5M9_9AGAR|nr:hypothetical protein FB45DRAFT_760849 [Roridomyces roridus]